ncbi:putative protein isoform X2 [Capsicum galapagoense]
MEIISTKYENDSKESNVNSSSTKCFRHSSQGIYGRKINMPIAFKEVIVLSSYMCKGSQLDKNIKKFRKKNTNMQMEEKHVHLETRKLEEEMELVKDIASMKSKIIELERKISEEILKAESCKEWAKVKTSLYPILQASEGSSL